MFGNKWEFLFRFWISGVNYPWNSKILVFKCQTTKKQNIIWRQIPLRPFHFCCCCCCCPLSAKRKSKNFHSKKKTETKIDYNGKIFFLSFKCARVFRMLFFRKKNSVKISNEKQKSWERIDVRTCVMDVCIW